MSNLQVEGLHQLMGKIDQLAWDYTQDKENIKGVINGKWKEKLSKEFDTANLSVIESGAIRALIIYMLSEKIIIYKENNNIDDAEKWEDAKKAFIKVLIDEEAVKHTNALKERIKNGNIQAY